MEKNEREEKFFLLVFHTKMNEKKEKRVKIFIFEEKIEKKFSCRRKQNDSEGSRTN